MRARLLRGGPYGDERLKCTLCGAITAIVCCKGMTASGGAQGVGRVATRPEIDVIR